MEEPSHFGVSDGVPEITADSPMVQCGGIGETASPNRRSCWDGGEAI
jgi:hypothetical protein